MVKVTFLSIIGIAVLTVISIGYKPIQAVNENATEKEACYLDITDTKYTEDIEQDIRIKSVAKKLPVLMYHYVEYVTNKKDKTRIRLNINPDEFERQLRSIKQNAKKTAFAREIPTLLNGTSSTSNTVVLTFDDGYENFYYNVFPLLKKYEMKATIYVIYNYIGQKGFLKYYQLKEMLDSGIVEVGSHTLDHVYLKQATEQIAREQIIESKKKLEQSLNIEVKTFAYPFGAHNSEAENLVKEAGYTVAVTTIKGAYLNTDNLLVAPRLRMENYIGSDISKVIDSL